MVFFDALVPLMLKLTVAGGVPVVAQVYVRVDSPAASAPSTERAVVVPVTGLGVAAAPVATVGAVGVMVTDAVPFTDPQTAFTVADPVVPGAEYKPDELIDPPPVNTDQVMVGDAMVAPN